jgi:hypothetical protein
MNKKYKVRVSIPVEYDISELMTSFDTTVDVEAENNEDAVNYAIREFNEDYDLDSIYDEIYGEIKSNLLVWLDGDYNCDTYDEDYYFAEEQKPRPFPGMEGKGIDGSDNKHLYLTSTGVDDDKGVEVNE